jgi:15-cis-phytoene synthase
MPLTSDTEAADLAACRLLLSDGSKSFAMASRFLPRAVRDPAIALYAFCREADDAIDHGGDNLDWVRDRLDRIYAGQPLDRPADKAFARIVRRFALPRSIMDALIEGFAWDTEPRRYQNLSELRAYASRVAGSVGAMMAILMGVRDRPRLGAAVELGIAMQLSNIARDVGQDARDGRLYLPIDWLRDAGMDPDLFVANPAFSPELGGVVSRLLDAAEGHYWRAGAGIGRLPVSVRFGIAAASLLYAEIGNEVRRRGMDSISARATVSPGRKVGVLAAGLPAKVLTMRGLTDECAREGMFLVDAAASCRTSVTQKNVARHLWSVKDRLVWTIDLFQRLEQRERV